MSRFDNRSVDTFKKDIKFSTLLEKFFFEEWINSCTYSNNIVISNPRNNGVDNSGDFIEKGSTSGADYMIDIEYNGFNQKDLPIEIKWVPTYGKLTLKNGDLKAYLREDAAILFIYTGEKVKENLKKPKDYNLTEHINLIQSISDKLRWSIMLPEQVKSFYRYAESNNMIKPIPYMGNKPGVILHQQDFSKWFKEEKWNH